MWWKSWYNLIIGIIATCAALIFGMTEGITEFTIFLAIGAGFNFSLGSFLRKAEKKI